MQTTKNIHPPWSNDINFGVKLHFYNWISIGFVVLKENLDNFIALNRYKYTAFGISKWIASPLAYHSVYIFISSLNKLYAWVVHADADDEMAQNSIWNLCSCGQTYLSGSCLLIVGVAVFLCVYLKTFKSKSMQKSTQIDGAQQKHICWTAFCTIWQWLVIKLLMNWTKVFNKFSIKNSEERRQKTLKCSADLMHAKQFPSKMFNGVLPFPIGSRKISIT